MFIGHTGVVSVLCITMIKCVGRHAQDTVVIEWTWNKHTTSIATCF